MSVIRLRKYLDRPVAPVVWPSGIRPVPFASVDPRLVHQTLEIAFPGLVAPFADWYGNLTHDDEFDPDLCFPAMTEDGAVAGFVQSWTSNFIKDLAVSPDFRGRGVGAALMQHTFSLFAARGAPSVDLKTSDDDDPSARRLYHRLGMVEVPL